MKTFKLKSLEVMENTDGKINRNVIPLLDGLIINRGNDVNQWVIEAYISNSYLTYFKALQEEKEKEVMLQVKISKESNDPAIFKTSIIAINEIGPQMNVLFKGNIIDQRKDSIEEMLRPLIKKGYHGDELLTEFNQLMKKG